ncbi:hypothetical protein [Vallitalea sp.]|jgi:hypothetical protein|uniref:hypothetical protein n=1 Tax=Vallitalea sp. TaxID=1882829 RepID=UPI0025EFFDEE|nr:hypothetical protein [Vallitalea sp.]MCT4686381.1 hypothetical protein [Vallitalea sp.]
MYVDPSGHGKDGVANSQVEITLYDPEVYENEMNRWEWYMREDLEKGAYTSVAMDYVMWKLTQLGQRKDYITSHIAKAEYETNGTSPEVTKTALDSAITYNVGAACFSLDKMYNGAKGFVKNKINSIKTSVTNMKYEYNMAENPGPLAEMPGNPASNFAEGKYNTIKL